MKISLCVLVCFFSLLDFANSNGSVTESGSIEKKAEKGSETNNTDQNVESQNVPSKAVLSGLPIL